MIKVILPLALLALAVLYKIHKDFEGDLRKAILDVVLLLFLLFATGFTVYLRVYTPLLFFHISLLLVGWGSYLLYLFGKGRKIILILSPLVTIIAFFAAGLWFGD
ncbi:MAG: hypothetical protein GXO19_05025 [Epsilonproteobacteria bacterium]|nr:hypothetical protein [Campylobacterota bacterium]NPA57080.1 hypothetical protein [Campylobacterota bacterium]